MKRFVVDASVATKWFVPEEHTEQAEALLADDVELLAPDLLLLEVGGVMWQRVRRTQMTASEAENVLDGLPAMSIELVHTEHLARPALALAVQTNQTIYDSAYLALAVQEKAQLITADRKFYQALQPTPFKPHIQFIADYG